MTHKTTHPQLLPADLAEAASPALSEAITRLASRLEEAEDAAAAKREAAVAFEAAPDHDDKALRVAVEARKPNPQPTTPQREAEYKAATQREDKARELAHEAVDQYRHALGQDRNELVRLQEPRVNDAAAAIAQTLDGLENQIDEFALEAGRLQGLHKPRRGATSPEAIARTRAMGRALSIEIPSFDPDPATVIRGHLSGLRAAVEELRRNATPLRQRILDAIGDGQTTWDDVAAKLDVRPVDSKTCAIRGFLLDERVIEWCDRDGGPIVPASAMVGSGIVVAQRRYLRRNDSPPLSPTQAARQAARAGAVAVKGNQDTISTLPPGAGDAFDETGAVKGPRSGKTPEVSRQIDMQGAPDRKVGR
jgi:hypothetical protein